MRPQTANSSTANRAPTALTLHALLRRGAPASVHISSPGGLVLPSPRGMATYLGGGSGCAARYPQASMATMARPVSSRTTATVCSGLSKANEWSTGGAVLRYAHARTRPLGAGSQYM